MMRCDVMRAEVERKSLNCNPERVQPENDPVRFKFFACLFDRFFEGQLDGLRGPLATQIMMGPLLEARREVGNL